MIEFAISLSGSTQFTLTDGSGNCIIVEQHKKRLTGLGNADFHCPSLLLSSTRVELQASCLSFNGRRSLAFLETHYLNYVLYSRSLHPTALHIPTTVPTPRRLLRPSRVPSTVAHRHSFDRRPGTCSRRYKGCYGLLRADKRSHREQSKGPKRERPCAFRSGTGPLAKLTRGHDSPPTPTGCVAKERSAGGVQNPKAPA